MQIPVIHNKIYEIRDQKSMPNFDLVLLFEVETKAINQAVKRNADRFPKDFMFRLIGEKWQDMQSQTVTASPTKEIQKQQPMHSPNMGYYAGLGIAK